MKAETLREGADRRTTPRKRVFVAGTICMGKGSNWLRYECIVVNQSEMGARLRVAPDIDLPAEFRLISGSDQHERRAHLVWRDGDQVGISFDDDRETMRDAGLLDRVQKLEREVRLLRRALMELKTDLPGLES